MSRALNDVAAGTLFGVALNYKGLLDSRLPEFQQPPYQKPPVKPVLFIKTPNTRNEHDAPVLFPRGVERLQPGPALGVVIARDASRVKEEEAMAHVAGYVIVNEFSLPEDSYYRPAVKAKCRDGFCPFGPQLVPAQEIADPHALELKLYVNGELRQRNNEEPTMKHARIRYQGQVHQVTVEDANAVRLADGTLLAEDRVEWLPPATGSMFALGLNYADHAAELSFKAPSEPLAFIKSPGTYTGHRQVSWRPDNVDYMHYECELVAVIGKPARNVRREDALGYLAGYTVCNDYAIRDYLENYYRPNLRVKNRDATTPVGPWIVDAAEVPEPNRLTLRTWVNGELRQEGSTADMIFDIPYLIEYFSSFMTLQPGDMIATGTPEGLSDVVPGDEVVVEVEGVGRLVNRIVSEAEFFRARAQEHAE